MLSRILVVCLLVAAEPLTAGVIHAFASGSAGPIDATATETIVNAPLSSEIVSWTRSGGGGRGGSFPLSFPAVSVPEGNTVTKLLLWVIATYTATSESVSARPVVAGPFYAAQFMRFPGDPNGWTSSMSLEPGMWFHGQYSELVDISSFGPAISAVNGGTPLTLHAGWSVSYWGPGELRSSGYNAITQITLSAIGSPGLWASLEVYFEPQAVPEPGTTTLFCLAVAYAACRLIRARRRDALTR